MRLLDKKELLELKRNYFSSTQKTLCKKFEQTGGSFTFKVDDSKFVFKHDGSKAYTDFEESKLKYNSGIMHKGNNVRSMDKHHKFNHNEYKVHKSIDKKNK
jgi:hypothetical protein|tara:strand:+ start:333 stop:635 length:303 start_codon:yes stop_codon:yes gene_type:complete